MANISIILPTIGRKSLLLALNSIYEQMYQDFEVIVVDDSVNQNIEIEDHPKLIVLQTGGDRGVSFARNLGFSHSTSDWIAFADDDDVWHFEKLNKQMQLIQKENLDLLLTSANVVSTFTSKRPKKLLKVGESPYQALYGRPHILRSDYYFPTASILVRASYLKNFLFNEELEDRENIKLLQDIYLFGGKLAQMKESLVTIKYNSQKSLGRAEVISEQIWLQHLGKVNENFATNFAIESARNFVRVYENKNALLVLSQIKISTPRQRMYIIFLKILCHLLK